MRWLRSMGLCIVGTCAMSVAVAGGAASSALAEAPELGRCLPAEKTIEGNKNHWKGAYKNRACTVAHPTHEGHWEWAPGPGPNPEFVGAGLAEETATLETAAGRKVVCTNGTSEGTLTGAKSEKLKLTLIGCEDTTSHVKCQNFTPEIGEPKPTPGKIQTQPLVGGLGFINKAKKRIGWDVKPESGSVLVEFECGETPVGAPRYFVEGSYITRILPVNKSIEEYIQFYEAKGGKQTPESFEGGPPDTLKVKVLEGAMEKNESIGLSEIESFGTFDTVVFRTV